MLTTAKRVHRASPIHSTSQYPCLNLQQHPHVHFLCFFLPLFIGMLNVQLGLSQNLLAQLTPPTSHHTISHHTISHYTSILDLNNKFLEELQSRMATWTTSTVIGDLFLKFGPFFKMYTQVTNSFATYFIIRFAVATSHRSPSSKMQYVNNHERIGPLLSEMKRSKKYVAFQKHEAEKRKLPEVRGLKMENFLIAPIQRCC